MKLFDLEFACFLYAQFTNYDDSYLQFLKSTNNNPDLSNPKHRKALLTWLNKWGCRQFAKEHHGHASLEISSWHKQFSSYLFGRGKHLFNLSEDEINSIIEPYDVLSSKIASYRNEETAVFFGPTGAAKILFAIRPLALIPWDVSMRNNFGYDDSGKSYSKYLILVKAMLKKIEDECNRNGFTLLKLPKKLGRNHSTLPKLIDEYHWVTITKKCIPPKHSILKKWLEWS